MNSQQENEVEQEVVKTKDDLHIFNQVFDVEINIMKIKSTFSVVIILIIVLFVLLFIYLLYFKKSKYSSFNNRVKSLRNSLILLRFAISGTYTL